MKRPYALAFVFLLIPWLAHADRDTMHVVASVDLDRYAGKWIEIARLPNWFQKKCTGEVSATYSPLGEGRLKVVNECRNADGGIDRAEGEARPAGGGGAEGKLEVRFAPAWLSWLGWVWGDYWILDLAPDYSYALVGTPDRKYLWVLSRTPRMDRTSYQRVLARAAREGFDTDRLLQTGELF